MRICVAGAAVLQLASDPWHRSTLRYPQGRVAMQRRRPWFLGLVHIQAQLAHQPGERDAVVPFDGHFRASTGLAEAIFKGEAVPSKRLAGLDAPVPCLAGQGQQPQMVGFKLVTIHDGLPPVASRGT